MSTELGRHAEAVAADFLEQQGFRILERNWRTRWCEIDIIAAQGQSVAFIEVKYRSNPAYGAGLDYITPRKVGQMSFAAELWLGRYKTNAVEYHISAIELTGTPVRVTSWLPDINAD